MLILNNLYIKAQQPFPHFVLRIPALSIIDVNTFDNPIKLNQPLHDVADDVEIGFNKYACVVGICRGLICFSVEKDPYTVFLYNPTRSHKILPAMPDFSLSEQERKNSYMGFGYEL